MIKTTHGSAQKGEEVVVDRLYGVLSTANVKLPFGQVPIALRPSRRLLDELRTLPRGACVCLETLGPEDRRAAEGILAKQGMNVRIGPEDDSDYWNGIGSVLDGSGLVAVYLKDAEGYAMQIAMGWEAEVFRHDLESASDRSASSALKRELYELEVAMNMNTIISMHDRMVDRIRESRPSVAVVQLAHAATMRFDYENGLIEGLSFGSYSVERGPKEAFVGNDFAVKEPSNKDEWDALRAHIHGLAFENVLAGAHSSDSYLTDGKNPVAQRSRILRKQYAIFETRITGRTPDYIGTWDPDVPANGLFEMFIDRRDGYDISGTIEDTDGTADFKGGFYGDIILFSMRYRKGHEQEKDSPPLAFEGVLKDGRVSGTYAIKDTSVAGRFEMSEFSRTEQWRSMLRT